MSQMWELGLTPWQAEVHDPIYDDEMSEARDGVGDEHDEMETFAGLDESDDDEMGEEDDL